MTDELEKLKKEEDKHYLFLQNFCYDYCKDEEERKEFLEHLGELINVQIEIEKFCNQ